MDDCITISDDEDVEIIEHLVSIDPKPIVIDLTSDPSIHEDYSSSPVQDDDATSSSSSQDDCPQPAAQEECPQSPLSDELTQCPMEDNSQPSPVQDQNSNSNSSNHVESSSKNQSQNHKPEPRHSQQRLASPIQQTRQSTGQQNNYPSPERCQANPPSPIREQQKEAPIQTEEDQMPAQNHNATINSTTQTTQEQSKSTPEEPPKKQHKPQMSERDLMMALKNLGNEKYRHNLFDEAIRTYKRANELARKLADDEMSAILHFNLAMSYHKVGSLDQAADECAQAVKLNDNYMKAHLKRAEIYIRQGKFEEAMICYEHICQLDSSNPDYAMLLNHSKEYVKKMKKKDYYQILGLHPQLYTREDLKKAYRQKALSHHPDRHSDADIVTRRIEEKRFKDASEAHSFIQVRLSNGR